MLDSSPIAPPRKALKRTASLASLPSPPPTVQQPKKRRSNTGGRSDVESGSDDGESGDEGVLESGTIVGRKLLFPAGPSRGGLLTDDTENPFVDNEAPDFGDQLASETATSPSKQHRVLASPPPSKGKPSTSKSVAAPPRTPSPSGLLKGFCTADEQPVLVDEEENPFLDRPKSKSKPKTRRSQSPHNLKEKPTVTYVFKGMKLETTNPYYNLPESAFEKSRLPLGHPDYSPPPVVTPKRLFPEAFKNKEGDNDNDDDEDDRESSSPEPHTPDNKPRLSGIFVDEEGNPLPDSGPQGIRGKLDTDEIGRMAVGPLRGRR